jgi:hypothetical protein
MKLPRYVMGSSTDMVERGFIFAGQVSTRWRCPVCHGRPCSWRLTKLHLRASLPRLALLACFQARYGHWR